MPPSIAAPSPPPVAAPIQPPVAVPPTVAAPVAPPVAAPSTPAPILSARAPAARSDDEDSALLLPRAELDQQLGDIELLSAQVAVAPERGGGYRVAALRPGSFLESLGLRPGDVIRRIDGRPINTPDDAARAGAWLRVADHFTVDVLRDGAPVQLRFEIEG